MCGIHLLVLSICGISLANSESLADGLMVTGGLDLRTQAAEWTIIVTLDVVKRPVHLANQVEQVYNSIANIPVNLTTTTINSWRNRLQRYQQRLEFIPHKRQKRGLINIFGDVAHVLFGLATSDQVNEVRNVVEDLRQRSGAVGHAVNQLTTVVNRTRVYVQENRQRLEELQMQELAIQRYIQSWSRAYNRVVETLRIMETRLEMERVLEALDLALDVYTADYTQYRSERAALEAGRLTEELLPRGILGDVLREARMSHLESVTELEWYYETVNIEPVWGDEATLVYIAKIPLVDPTRYLHYTISTWPMPYENQDLSARLEVGKNYGFDTRSGDIFIPHACVGQYPIVCRSGPLYNSQALRCPRGILTNQPELRKHCVISLIKGKNVTALTQVDINQYVIVTWGERYVERCDGKPEVNINLPAGVHLVTVNETCILAGQSWTVRGVIQKSSHVSIASQRVPDIDPLQLEIKIPALDIISMFESKPLNALETVQQVSLDNIQITPMNPIHWKTHKFAFTWLIVVIAVLGCIGAVVGLTMVYYFKCRIRNRGKRVPTPIPERDAEMEEQIELEEI